MMVGKLDKDVSIDIVFTENGLVLNQAETVQPSSDIHVNWTPASVPNPGFAISAATTDANFGFERTLANYDSRAVLVSEALLKVSRQR